jgi:O-antigen ligase
VAREIFKEHRLFGVGGWGYPHFAMAAMTPEERKVMQIQGGANVHNDTLQFLAEQGAVGFGLMALCALTLIVPLAVQAVRTTRALSATGIDAIPAKPVWLYHLPPEVVAVFVGAAATVCHSLGDLPFRSPAVLTVWLLAFACAGGFLPAVRRK